MSKIVVKLSMTLFTSFCDSYSELLCNKGLLNSNVTLSP